MNDAYKVEIDQDLEPLIPTFLSNLQQDVNKVKEAIQNKESEPLCQIGHKGKGASGSYGFELLEKLFLELETFGKNSDFELAQQKIDEIDIYLSSVEIKYVELDY